METGALTSDTGEPLEILFTPFSQKYLDKLTRFHYQLSDELDQFTLNVDQIASAYVTCNLWDAQGNMQGVGGVRSHAHTWTYFLVIHKSHQGRGWGKKMTRMLISHVPKNRPLMLTVRSNNMASRVIYKDAGFVTVGRIKSIIYMLHPRGGWGLIKWPIYLMLKLKGLSGKSRHGW